VEWYHDSISSDHKSFAKVMRVKLALVGLVQEEGMVELVVPAMLGTISGMEEVSSIKRINALGIIGTLIINKGDLVKET
jgi:hypothetical protein